MEDNPYKSPHQSSPQSPRQSMIANILGVHLLPPMVSCLGTAFLIVALLHVHSDRSQTRQPIITYVGPLSDWMPHLIYIGLVLSLLGFLSAGLIVHRSQQQFLPTSTISATIAMMLAVVNAMFTFIVYGGIMED